MRRTIVEAPRWFFLGVLVYAPWAYGSTRIWTIDILKVLMAIVVLLWLVECIVRQRRPQVNAICLGCVSLLLCAGWWMVLNAKAYYDADHAKLELISWPIWITAPGAVESGFSLSAMARLSGLLGILCFTIDLAQRPQWRVRLWWTMGLTGASLILFGLLERIAGAPMIFWEQGRSGASFFATYFYHANAGAFINLVLPLIFGLAVSAFSTREADGRRMLWAPAVLICVAGAFVNTSRAAQAITVIILVILISWRLASWAQAARYLSTQASVVYGCAALAALFAVGALCWTSLSPRWALLSRDIWTMNGRLFALRVCERIVPDAGLMGFGPGTFQIVFPYYITPDEKAHVEQATQLWRYAHEDYIQTVIEWGWIGSTAWALLFAGGLFTGITTFFRGKNALAPSDRVLLFASLTALLGIALHALVDFPLQIASLQLYAGVCLGLCWSSPRWLRATPRRTAAPALFPPV